jgi:hypothetical protein
MSAKRDHADGHRRKLVFSYPLIPPFPDCYRNKIAYRFYLLANGTNAGNGLSQILNGLPANISAPQSFYMAARMYDSGSGSIDPSGDSILEGSVTYCYASDVANRLLGWANTLHGCSL